MRLHLCEPHLNSQDNDLWSQLENNQDNFIEKDSPNVSFGTNMPAVFNATPLSIPFPYSPRVCVSPVSMSLFLTEKKKRN